MPETERPNRIVRVSDASLHVANPDADVRGRTVLDRDGEVIGKVDDLLVDERERRVRFLQVAAGGFLGLGERHLLLPVDAVIRVAADHVQVEPTRKRIADAPRYDPTVVPPPDYVAGVYDWFGVAPAWTPVAVPEHEPVSADIPAGTEVVGSDEEKVGEVVAAFRDYIVVQKGFFFPSDRYIPRNAIRGYDGHRIQLTVSKDTALDQPWHKIPPERSAAGRDAIET